nr:hypothetical protein [Tanacetum cinerariifolium]
AHPEDDDDEDPEEDPVDYLADRGDDGDDEEESSEDNEDDDMDIEADEEEEEEHSAPAESVVVASTTADQASSAEETEPFETDESAATPPPHPAYRMTARISIPAPVPMPAWSDSEIVRLLAMSSPPASPLSPWSSPPSQIPFPPLPPVLSPHSPVLSPAPPPSPIRSLSYRAAMIQLRAEAASTSHSPPLQLPSANQLEVLGQTTALDRHAHAYTRQLMETEARMSREAWVLATDASDLVHGEVMSLRTTVLGQMSEIRELQAADRRRQTVISELLRTDHKRSTEITELRTALQGQETGNGTLESEAWTDLEVARLLAISSPPASPLSPWSSPPPRIPFPPLPPILSPPSPILSPAPPPSPIRSLGYRAAMIRLRDEAASTSPPPSQLPSASHREDRPEVTLLPQKRLGIALGPRYEVGESSSFVAARPAGGFREDYGFGAPVSTDTELGGYVREFETRVRQDMDEIYTRLDDEQTEQQLLAGRLNMLFRDRCAHAYTRQLMETEARMSREAWLRATDASNLVHGEVISLRTTVLGQISEIRELQAADRRRQTVISELLRIDH